jgi:hypothetical protein
LQEESCFALWSLEYIKYCPALPWLFPRPRVLLSLYWLSYPGWIVC